MFKNNWAITTVSYYRDSIRSISSLIVFQEITDTVEKSFIGALGNTKILEKSFIIHWATSIDNKYVMLWWTTIISLVLIKFA